MALFRKHLQDRDILKPGKFCTFFPVFGERPKLRKIIRCDGITGKQVCRISAKGREDFRSGDSCDREGFKGLPGYEGDLGPASPTAIDHIAGEILSIKENLEGKNVLVKSILVV
jgi:hypothetical protein